MEALEARGWSVFWDTTLLPGETWRRKITKELDAARCVIVLWSESSVESHWVEQEADEGLRRGILVPAMIDRVTIPLGFRSLQAANLAGWDGSAGHGELEKMLRAIEIHVPFGAKAAAAGTSSVRAIPLTLTREDNLVTIAGGTFWMGAQKTDQSGRSYDPEAGDDEGPPHQVTLRGFRMARFPVTVKEFARFVDSGGYREGKNWVAGDLAPRVSRPTGRSSKRIQSGRWWVLVGSKHPLIVFGRGCAYQRKPNGSVLRVGQEARDIRGATSRHWTNCVQITVARLVIPRPKASIPMDEVSRALRIC